MTNYFQLFHVYDGTVEDANSASHFKFSVWVSKN